MAGLPLRRKAKAFTLIELMICMGILLTLLSSLYGAFQPESAAAGVHRDMDRLAHWLESAMLRADRWKMDFYLTVNASWAGDSRHKMILRWISRRKIVSPGTEFFFADEGVRWKLQNADSSHSYSWSTHTVSPAFVVSALTAGREDTGEKLTLSVRGLATRSCSCGRR